MELVTGFEEVLRLGEDHWSLSSGEERRLWDVQREALLSAWRRMPDRLKGIIQMPTGSGKSVVMAFLLQLIAFFYDGEKRNILIVLAPLNRIKDQLFETFKQVLSGFGSQPLAVVVDLSSRRLRMSEPLDSYVRCTHNISSFVTVPDKLALILREWECLRDISGKMFLVLLVHPSGLRSIYDSGLLEILRERTLALFVDEMHYGYSGSSRRSNRFLVAEMARGVPVVLGFSATPVRSVLDLFATESKLMTRDVFIYRKSCVDLTIESMRMLLEGKEPILVPHIRAYFYDTRFDPGIKPTKFWGYPLRNRVSRYMDKLFEVLRNEKVNLEDLKVLVLAPNIEEANIWEEELRSRFPNAKVVLAHSSKSRSTKRIEEFVCSSRGVLVAVDMVKLGFDDPDLDMLVIARPTRSPVAYVQMRGRLARWPRRDCLKRRRCYGILVHLASSKFLESTDVIREAELARCFVKSYDLKGFKVMYPQEEVPLSVLPSRSGTLIDLIWRKALDEVIIPHVKGYMKEQVRRGWLRFENGFIAYVGTRGSITTKHVSEGGAFRRSVRKLYLEVLGDALDSLPEDLKRSTEGTELSVEKVYRYLGQQEWRPLHDYMLSLLKVEVPRRRGILERIISWMRKVLRM